MPDFFIPNGKLPRFFHDANGKPLSGTFEAFKARTTTPLNVFSDINGTVIGDSVTVGGKDGDGGFIEQDDSALNGADTLVSVLADAPTGVFEASGFELQFSPPAGFSAWPSPQWDPDKTGNVTNGSTDKDHITLSNGNKTVELTTDPGGEGGNYYANAINPQTSGKWYFEILVDRKVISTERAGLAEFNDAESIDDVDAINWAYIGNGNKNCDGSDVDDATLSSYTTGDVLMFAVDVDAGKIWFGKNGTFGGDPAAGTGANCSNVEHLNSDGNIPNVLLSQSGFSGGVGVKWTLLG